MVEALGAPVVTTVNGKGILPPDHPLLVGTLLPFAPVQEELAAADVVLAIGTELGETDTYLMGDWPRINGTLIRVDIEPDQLSRNAPASLGIIADAAAFAAALAPNTCGKHAVQNGAPRAKAARYAKQPLPISTRPMPPTVGFWIGFRAPFPISSLSVTRPNRSTAPI